AVVYAFLCLAAWYPVRALPLAAGRAAVAAATHLATAAVSAALWVGMASALARALARSPHWSGAARLSSEHAGLVFVLGVLLYLLSVALHYLYAAAEASRAAERRALEAEVAAREAELAALKAQLDPHFLFNSLNSVASLAGSDPAGARAMCIELADYLRGTLEERGARLHPLARELTQVRRYLNVEKVRFGPRLRVVEEVADCCLDDEVPPLILQPLVENALKHGIAGLVEGGELRIGAARRGDALTLWVENPVDPDGRPRGGAGIGLANVRERLAKVFGDEARLRHGRSGEVYRAEVSLPLRDNEAGD
ncbi:MAG: histidine kinase, partial [Thermoanaerobaculales bacterium]|nr:histidine kinase [Thermoanaerobaculales bacterium]